MNPLLAAELAQMARNLTPEQRARFQQEVQRRIESSGMNLSPEAIDGAFSLLGVIANGRLSIPGLSHGLLTSLKRTDARRLSSAIAREASPERRAERAAQVSHLVESTAPIRAAGVEKLTTALNKAGESVAGKGDLGDKARDRGRTLAKVAGALGNQARVKAAEALENTAAQRAAALETASTVVGKASESVSTANSASATLRRHLGAAGGTGAKATGAASRAVGKASRTVGSAGAAVDLAGVVLDSLDEVLGKSHKAARPEDV